MEKSLHTITIAYNSYIITLYVHTNNSDKTLFLILVTRQASASISMNKGGDITDVKSNERKFSIVRSGQTQKVTIQKQSYVHTITSVLSYIHALILNLFSMQ